MQVILVCTTVDSEPVAQSMARTLIERQLAACVQIHPITSVYRWQDQVEQGQEFKLTCKTTADLYRQVEHALRELHPYELPAIYATPLDLIYAPFEQWVKDETEVNRHPRA